MSDRREYMYQRRLNRVVEESDQRDSYHLEENEPEDRVNEHEGQGSEDGMCWSIYHLFGRLDPCLSHGPYPSLSRR